MSSPRTIEASVLVRSRRHRGFALLVTIVLVAFLVLVLVGLATFTRVETQVAANNQSSAQARQNALLALNIALGQLQKHAGPDQRVTARADITSPTGHTWTTLPLVPSASDYASARTTDATSFESYWQTARNRHWTGVWLNGRNNPADYDRANPSAFTPLPELQSWLVSGNETNSSAFSPLTAITGLTISSTPLDRILDADGNAHRILLKSSANVTAANELHRAVTAPEIPLVASNIPGFDTPQTVGHYAWWVGDEGIKARANLIDPRARPAAGETSAERLRRETLRRQAASRTAIESMSSNGTDGLAPLTPPSTTDELKTFQDDLLKIVTPAQLAYLVENPALPDELKSRFHDLSTASRGVLSDTKNGGLKRDLTYILGQPSIIDLQTALHAAYGTNAVAPDPIGNRLFRPAGTIYASFPANASTNRPFDDSAAAPGVFGHAATWEQLWSFHNMGNSTTALPPGVFDASGVAIPRRQTNAQHGLYPLVIQAKLFYRLRIQGGSPDPDGVNRTGILYVDTIPVAVIANPHSVPLGPADYQLRISGSRPQLVFGSTDSTNQPSADFIPAIGQTVMEDDPNSTEVPPPKISVMKHWPQGPYSEPSSYIGSAVFVLRSVGMAAGEAQIFTIDPESSANPTINADERILITSASDTRQIVLKNEYDPIPALTFNTNRTIPNAPLYPASTNPVENTIPTRAALRSGSPQLNTRLYLDYVAAEGDRRLLQFIRGQEYRADLGLASGEQRFLIVDPLADGIRQGGGYNMALNQAPVNPTSTSGLAATLTPQQAPFYQVNYRGSIVYFGGSDTTGRQHTLEWARTFAKNGSTGSAGNSPNPWIASNLLRPSGDTTRVRWGIVNIGEGQDQTVPPSSIGGSSAGDIGFKNFLYDIPTPEHGLVSLGQLQHFNVTGYISQTGFENNNHRSSHVTNSWQVNYAPSNSYPHPRVARDQIFGHMDEHGAHYDGSYLWNDLLWDRFYFSTYPRAGEFDFESQTLPNSRLRPFRDRATVPWDDEDYFRGGANPATSSNSRLASQNLLVEGAFNINSTSVEAWKALFSSLKNVPHGADNAPSAPFARTLFPDSASTSAGAAAGNAPNAWHGFRDLTPAEIQALAEEMVLQVRKRGPFLSLAEFVNRRLMPGRTSNAASSASDPLRLGLSGALQAALDAVTNLKDNIAPPFDVPAKPFVSISSNNSSHNVMRDADYRMTTGLAGFPGYLLQADILSALGPALSARSDTFTIRTYGDSVNPSLAPTDPNYVTSRAWCEAVVQRIPDYVDPSDEPHATPAAGSTNAKFGRRFQIVSFRWLSPDDI